MFEYDDNTLSEELLEDVHFMSLVEDNNAHESEENNERKVRKDIMPFAQSVLMLRNGVDYPAIGSAEAEAEKAWLRHNTALLMEEFLSNGGRVKIYNSKGEVKQQEQ
ncbi:hypothetical protein [Caudoviricetes sp.]|nr:hypothetical protein [Caudoviricetes sp.]UOF79118.1 hypothetical protein [Caudoviricetes sp.]